MKTLMASWRIAHERLGDQAVFVVAGDGPEAPRVRAELDFARHLGFLGRGTVADLYADADLFVFPSPTETCGLVALEAMASGSPVVCCDAGGARNSVRDGLTGLVVPAGDPVAFADAICSLATDASRRDAMAQAARAFAVGCDWSRELDVLEALYGSLAGVTRTGILGPVTGGAGTAGMGMQVLGA
ncbi:MAG: glycosyltransferase [Gemmatimonadales bacterium]